MKKLLVLFLGLVTVGALMVGCGQDQEQGSVIAPANMAATNAGLVDVLIGFDGARGPIAAINAAGGTVKHEYRNFPVVFASVPSAAVNALQRNPNILYVEGDVEKFYSAQTLDWGVDRVDAEYVHANSGYTGTGINVAILDSGGDIDHPDLTWAGGYSATAADPNNWNDKNGHGTHVAGIISANDNSVGVVGVAPNCNVYAVQVGSRRLLTSDIIEGIDWCIATHSDGDPNNDIQVMNMSFGGGYSAAEEAALQTAYNLGIVECAAAGNESGAVSYPAKFSFVLAVSSSTSSDGFSSFSNFGSEVAIMAPGSSIYSTYKGGGYSTMSGTSMSCPMVVGGAALAWSASPNSSRDQIINSLLNGAEDVGLSSNQQGAGLLDAEKAAVGTTNGNDLGGPTGGGADTMHVASVYFDNNKKNLYTYVVIHDEAHANPVSGASVSLTLHHVGGNDYNFGGTTDANGSVKFTLRGISSGLCFDATVTSVVKSGTFYNSASNDETTDSYCIP